MEGSKRPDMTDFLASALSVLIAIAAVVLVILFGKSYLIALKCL